MQPRSSSPPLVLEDRATMPMAGGQVEKRARGKGVKRRANVSREYASGLARWTAAQTSNRHSHLILLRVGILRAVGCVRESLRAKLCLPPKSACPRLFERDCRRSRKVGSLLGLSTMPITRYAFRIRPRFRPSAINRRPCCRVWAPRPQMQPRLRLQVLRRRATQRPARRRPASRAR